MIMRGPYLTTVSQQVTGALMSADTWNVEFHI